MFNILIALLLTASPTPWLTVLLEFPGGHVEICTAYGLNYDGSTVTIAVEACKPDDIFANGFEQGETL